MNEPLLKDVLLALLERQRTNFLMISAVQVELSALRNTVRALDPTFDDVLKREQVDSSQRDAETTRSVSQNLDELVRIVKEKL